MAKARKGLKGERREDRREREGPVWRMCSRKRGERRDGNALSGGERFEEVKMGKKVVRLGTGIER